MSEEERYAAAKEAAIGFFKYHGMTAERALLAYLKSEVLTPKQLKFKSVSYYDKIEERSNVNVRPHRNHKKEKRD